MMETRYGVAEHHAYVGVVPEGPAMDAFAARAEARAEVFRTAAQLNAELPKADRVALGDIAVGGCEFFVTAPANTVLGDEPCETQPMLYLEGACAAPHYDTAMGSYNVDYTTMFAGVGQFIASHHGVVVRNDSFGSHNGHEFGRKPTIKYLPIVSRDHAKGIPERKLLKIVSRDPRPIPEDRLLPIVPLEVSAGTGNELDLDRHAQIVLSRARMRGQGTNALTTEHVVSDGSA